jgi:hypothetical protein
MRSFLRLDFFVDAAELLLNAIDLMPGGFRLLLIQLRGSGARHSSLRAVHNRRQHLQIAQQFSGNPGGNFLLRLPLHFEKQLGIVQNAFADRRRTFAPHAIQLAGFPRIAVMLGEDRRHPLAIFQALACRRHQKLQRHLRQDLALAHLLLNGFRQNLHQRQSPRHPAHAAFESARQFVQSIAEAPLQLRQQPATSSAVSCLLSRSERSSSTAADSLVGHITASTVSRPSCSSSPWQK